MGKKYKLTGETISFDGANLYRIEALKDFYDVKKGDKGGWVEHYGNLSQLGDCWVYHNAIVKDNAVIKDDAKVMYHAKIFGDAIVGDNARVYDRAKVYGNAIVNENARIYGYALISGNAQVCGCARIYNNSKICGSAQVCGDVEVLNDTIIGGNAIVEYISDYIVFKNWWSSGRYFTWTKSNNMWSVDCFYGTGEELIAKAYKDSKLSGREYKRVVDYVKSILKDNFVNSLLEEEGYI